MWDAVRKSWMIVIVEESGWCWWWLVPAAEPPGSTVTLEWALRRTVPATAVSDLSMHNCVPMHKSHCADAHWTINIAVSMWGGGGALRQLPAAPSHEGWRGQRKVTEALFSPFHFSFALRWMRARIWDKSSLPILSILAFTVPFGNNQVAVTFSLKPTQHPLSSSIATASLYLWPIQAKLLSLLFSMHYSINADSKHGS